MSAIPAPSRIARVAAATAASVFLWTTRTLLGLLVMYPLLLAVEATGIVSGPDGDAVLFRPGGLLLLELLRLGLPVLGVASRVALVLAVLAAICQLVPLGVAFDLLWFPVSPLRERWSRASRLFSRFFGLGVITTLAQGAFLLASSLLGAALKSALLSHDERWASLASPLCLGLGLLACGGLGSVLDVARAALVQEERSWREALLHALVCLSERPYDLLLGAYPSVAAGALAYLSALWLSAHLDLSGTSNTQIAYAFAGQQLAVLFAIAWRVRWLGRALELSAESRSSR